MTNEMIIKALNILAVLILHVGTLASLGYAIWTTVICVVGITTKIIQLYITATETKSFQRVDFATECSAITFVWCLFALLKYFLALIPFSSLTNL